jgi:hypothetical protein
MDVVEDASMAVRSYVEHAENLDKGTLYLHTYGLLQALVLQQDAIFDLCDALGSFRTKGDFPALDAAREIRVAVAGHPTKRSRESREGPHFLIQMSLGHGSLEVMTMTSKEPRFKQVSLDGLMRDQELQLETILDGVIADLKDDEEKHRAPFRGRKLESVFPDTLGYCFEKIREGLDKTLAAPLAIWGIEQVKKSVEDYKSGLEERGTQIDTYPGIQYCYDLLQYPILQLDAYIRGEDSNLSNGKDAYVFTYFVQEHVNKLRAMARETDEEFQS